MTDRTIPVGELFDLAEAFKAMGRTLRQGADGNEGLLRAADAWDSAFHALRQLEATGRASDVVLRLPEGTEYQKASET